MTRGARLPRFGAVLVTVLVLVNVTLAWLRAANEGSYGFFAAQDAAPGLVVQLSSDAGLTDYSGLQSGDRIVSVDGVPASASEQFEATFWRSRSPGEPMQVGIQRADDATGAHIETVRFALYGPLSMPAAVAVPATQIAAALMYVFVALFVMLARPREPAGLPLLIMGAGLSLGVSSILWLAAPARFWPWIELGGQLVSALGFSGLIHVCLLLTDNRGARPPVSASQSARLHLARMVALLYAVPLIGIVVARAVAPSLQDINVLVYAAELGASMFILVRGYQYPATALTRAQIKWIGLAVLVMTIAAFAYMIVSVASGGNVPLAVEVLANATGATLPIAIGLSVLRYRLFDVDRIVRAAVTYALLTVLLGSAFLVLTLILSQMVLAVAGAAPADTSVPLVTAALAVAAIAPPAQRRLQDTLDRLVYRERLATRRFLQESVDVLGRAQPPDVVKAFLTSHAVERLGVTGAWLVVAPDVPLPTTAADTPSGAALLELASDLGSPIVLAGESLIGSGISVAESGTGLLADPRAAAWFDLGARLIVPLRMDPGGAQRGSAAPYGDLTGRRTSERDRLVGVWVLGGRRSKELPDREEITAAGQVGRRAALLLDYARLTQEQVHEELLRFELHQAKEVQNLLLDPLLTHLARPPDVACRYQPALEMSGDFFDVTWLPIIGSDGSAGAALQIAVGDVMGKGIAAAIVMALARSTLRAVAELSMRATVEATPAPGHFGASRAPVGGAVSAPSPAATLRITSGLLHHDIGRRIFVACALAIVECGRKDDVALHLRLANAAQVPPLLFRGGRVAELVPPGERLPLGILPAPEYMDLSVDLVGGDVVVFASDGLPEAPTTNGELLGFDRLASIVQYRAMSSASAEDIAAGIWSEVIQWCGTEPRHDDMALLVLRVPRPD